MTCWNVSRQSYKGLTQHETVTLSSLIISPGIGSLKAIFSKRIGYSIIILVQHFCRRNSSARVDTSARGNRIRTNVQTSLVPTVTRGCDRQSFTRVLSSRRTCQATYIRQCNSVQRKHGYHLARTVVQTQHQDGPISVDLRFALDYSPKIVS